MGATFRTVAVRNAACDVVRGAIVSWLRAKGFERRDETSLFPFDHDTERGVVLSETPGWVVVAFSHEFEEGDRLVFELNKLKQPLLETWVYDSDIWGYRLHDSSQLVASFNSNPRYFGGPAELELPQNGDPQRLCEVCDLPVDAQQIAALQRKRAVFKERIAERFCTAIGAATAAHDYRDFDELAIAPGRHVTASGIAVERMFFVRLGESDRQGPRLHDIVLRAPPQPEIDPDLAAWQAEMQNRMLPLTIALRGMMWGARIVGWLIGPPLRLWWKWKLRQEIKPTGLFADLQALSAGSSVERQGARLVNRRHGCSIEPGESAELGPHFASPGVFSFRIGELYIGCDAIRPSHVRTHLQIWPGCEIVADNKSFIGDFPARAVQLRYSAPQHSRHIIWHLIETPQAVYRFQASDEELSDEELQQIRKVVETFRLE